MGQYSTRIMANWFGNIKVNSVKNHLTLKDLRISKGFETATSFAEACCLNPSTYSQIETGGHIPNPKHKKIIADTLDMDIEEAFPPKEESKVKLTVIHESPSKLEVMLRNQFGDKLQPRQAL
ncbi:MAG: helix-turn-helix protein [Bacillales bacterium]|nr:helix-turn-helix protein [Bacillales bacterium]